MVVGAIVGAVVLLVGGGAIVGESVGTPVVVGLEDWVGLFVGLFVGASVGGGTSVRKHLLEVLSHFNRYHFPLLSSTKSGQQSFEQV